MAFLQVISSLPLILLLPLLALIIWTLIWKGIALWKSARNKDLVWFVILLVLNTVGILEIVYIFYLSKKKKRRK